MKKMIFLSAMVVLFGAGCASQDSYVANVKAPPSPVEAPQPTPPPPAPEPTQPPTSTPMQNTTSLAFPGELPAAQVNKKVLIKTNLGTIEIQLMPDQGPKAASNFYYLAKQGFYNGTIFHRVIPGFMIQGGDPTGTGSGGPGYQFPNDTVNIPYNDGIVAMANAGRDTNGSQFFIMVADYPLPPDYSIFGKVVKGLDIAHKIADVARNSNDRPNDEVKMIDVRVEE
ncbi:MAG: peptidylprolyl isomerase [Candidatus Uhrbacteria bacterium]|nr:peptidylprolyl isomerase [Candidatus Uhrbacteria bacterium]